MVLMITVLSAESSRYTLMTVMDKKLDRDEMTAYAAGGPGRL